MQQSQFKTERFFSRDLNKYHKRDVIIHSSPEYPNLIWCQEYDASKHRLKNLGPGIMICAAERNGNSRPYIPKDAMDTAIQRRPDGAKKRAAAKVRYQIGKEQFPFDGINQQAANQKFSCQS